MDEATSAMDSKLEKSIFEAIPNFSFSNLVCITHSTNMLKAFDTIYIFNNGSIEDSGTYEALKQRNGFLLSLLKEKEQYMSQFLITVGSRRRVYSFERFVDKSRSQGNTNKN